MPSVLPIQEVAYGLPVASISTINDLFVQVVWTEFYGLNPDDLSYTGYILKTVTIPVASISCAVEQNFNSEANETACSIVIKSGNATVLSLNNNYYCVDTSSVFTITDFNGINDSIYSASIA
jgi:hypothetical protein